MSSSSTSSPAKKKAKLEMTTIAPNWLELPRDVTANILQRLGAVEILMNARNVCPYWWNICKDPSMWRNIQMGTFHLYFQYTDLDCLVKMCEYAVNLSSGHLEQIDIFAFGTDALLQYIADRASHLRCIRLESCVRISDEGWCEVAKKFPLLEEVDISKHFQSKKTLEVIGQSCPLLKSLTYYRMSYGITVTQDDEAFVIAKTMPGLRYLDIRRNRLTNIGLLAILDGCPLLESLDIQGCDSLDITESLWERLNSQIKHLLIWEGCPNSYNNIVQHKFAYEDSSDDSYLGYDDEEEEEEKEEEEEVEEVEEEEEDDDDDDEEEEEEEVEEVEEEVEEVEEEEDVEVEEEVEEVEEEEDVEVEEVEEEEEEEEVEEVEEEEEDVEVEEEEEDDDYGDDDDNDDGDDDDSDT